MKKVLNVVAVSSVCLISALFICATVKKNVSNYQNSIARNEYISETMLQPEEMAMEQREDSVTFYSLDDYLAYANNSSENSLNSVHLNGNCYFIPEDDFEGMNLSRIKAYESNGDVVADYSIASKPAFDYDTDDIYLKMLLTNVRVATFSQNNTTRTDMNEFAKNLAQSVGADRIKSTGGIQPTGNKLEPSIYYEGDVYAWIPHSNNTKTKEIVGTQTIKVVYEKGFMYVKYVYTPELSSRQITEIIESGYLIGKHDSEL